MTEQMVKEHLEKVKERIKFYHAQKKEDIKANFLYEEFLNFTGDFNFLVDRVTINTLKFLVFNNARFICKNVHFAIKNGDDIQARYLMEKFMEIYEKVAADADAIISNKEKEPEFNKEPDFIVQAKAPVFICFKCDKDY